MAEPSDPSQQVSRQGRVFCEVDNGLECNVEGLNRDFMAERVERSGERSHWLWNTALDVEAKFFADFPAENAVFRSGIHFGGSIDDSISKAEYRRDCDAISPVRVNERHVKAELRGHSQTPINGGASAGEM